MSPEVDLQEVLERLADGELLAEIAQDLRVKRTTLYRHCQATKNCRTPTRARHDGLITRGERV